MPQSLPDGYELSAADVSSLRTLMTLEAPVVIGEPGDVLDRWRAELRVRVDHESLVCSGVDPDAVGWADVPGELTVTLARASVYVCDPYRAGAEDVHLLDAGDAIGADEEMFTTAILDGRFDDHWVAGMEG